MNFMVAYHSGLNEKRGGLPVKRNEKRGGLPVKRNEKRGGHHYGIQNYHKCYLLNWLKNPTI